MRLQEHTLAVYMSQYAPGTANSLLQVDGQLEHSLWYSPQSDCLHSDDQKHAQTFLPKVIMTSLEHHLVMS